MTESGYISSGIDGLDDILAGLRIGDNVVWSVDSIDDYRAFVQPYIQRAIDDKRNIVYFRFGGHAPVVAQSKWIRERQIDAFRGFESFAIRIHEAIKEEGFKTFYVFDCLSELLSAWATDSMIANFFRVTCPYLYQLDTVAYFAIRRGRHSFECIERIRETTQLLIQLYNLDGIQHIHPIKVWKRKSPTMFLPHIREDGRFVPIADSRQATLLLGGKLREGGESARRRLDHWDRMFLAAEKLASPDSSRIEQERLLDQLSGVMIGREERILSLARRYFSIADLTAIHSRMVGTGYIGGKSVGMLLARNILLQDTEGSWKEQLEPHDSFFVGSDLYYSFIVHNGLWPLLMRQKTNEEYFEAAHELGQKMLEGRFPDDIRAKFQQTLDYFGQYPIIVRSSSLLEDGFGNAFAGKYDSFFCVNQGTPEERLERLEEAIRKIYASTMSEDALAYRRQRNLERVEEQMALLIQRVSGTYRKHYYFPELAGVGVSYNIFVWDNEMEPKAGMLRLVLGLGTRAVDRVEGDYPRIVALDEPLKMPHKDLNDTRRYSQRMVDLLDLETNELRSVPLDDLADSLPDFRLEHYATQDLEAMRGHQERTGIQREIRLLTFEKLFSETDFVTLLQSMLKTLEAAYQYPVDVEFTIQFDSDRNLFINPVQCRPLQAKGEGRRVILPERIDKNNIFIEQQGCFMGGSVSQFIHWIVFVYPETYVTLSLEKKHFVGRIVRRINDSLADREMRPTMLMGPGRWGTTTPVLGVPVRFSDINQMTALVEVSFQSGEMIPELSYGSHFFQDLVESNIFYMAVFPENPNVFFNRPWLESLPNRLSAELPDLAEWENTIRLVDVSDFRFRLMSDIVSQRLLCHFE